RVRKNGSVVNAANLRTTTLCTWTFSVQSPRPSASKLPPAPPGADGEGRSASLLPSPSLSPNEVSERASLSRAARRGRSQRHGNEPDPAPPRHRTPRHSIVDTTAGAGTPAAGTTPHRRFDVPCPALPP